MFLETKLGQLAEEGATLLPCSGHFLPTNHKLSTGGQEATNSWHCTGFFYCAYYHVYFSFSSLYALFDLLPKPLYRACFLSVLFICTYCTYLDIYMNICVLWSAFIEVQLGDLFKCQYSSLWYYLLFVLYTFFFYLMIYLLRTKSCFWYMACIVASKKIPHVIKCYSE